MLRFLLISLALSTHAFGAYTNARGNVAFQAYLNLAKDQGEAVSIVHPSLPGYVESCSGTLFKEGYVATAGHCVTDEQGNLLSNPDRYIISHGLDKQNPDYISTGRKVHLHPKYSVLANGGRAYDVAIIDLGYSPNVSKYGSLASNPPQIGDILTGYGYGIVGDNIRGITNRHNTQLVAYRTKINAKFPNQPEIINASFDTTLPLAGIAASGDSGGGLKNEKGEIVAITSSVNRVLDTQAPTNMQMIDITKVSDFITSSRLKIISTEWTGTGNTSNPGNWRNGVIPQNSADVSYDPATISDKTDMIVDKNLEITELTMTHPNSSFTVNQGQTVDFSHGLELKGKGTINGTLRASFLRVEGKYSSPSGTYLYGNGNIVIEESGEIQTSQFLMNGGRVFGNGEITLTGTQSFLHQDGYLDPGTRTGAGVLKINGAYQQSGHNSAISINLFNDRSSDYLIVGQNNSSSLNFFIDFPDKIIPPGAAYRIFTASSGNTSIQPSFTTNPLYTSTGSYLWQGNELIVIINNLSMTGLSVQAASNTRPDIYKGLQNLRASGALVPPSLFKTIRQMSHETFYKSLSAFSAPQLQKNLHKTFSNTSVRKLHKSERVTLFLEKKRQALDLKSFSFFGKDSFSGADISVPENVNSPFSLFISGDLYDNTSNYITEGLTFGGDYAEGSTMTGLSFHFKNKSVISNLYNPNLLPNEYHFDLYHAKRGPFYFYDYSFAYGNYAKDFSYRNIWGQWDSHVQAHQSNIDTRVGAYKIDEKSLHLGYIGLSGSFSKVDPFSTSISKGLVMNTTESSITSLESKIGFESKNKFHFGDIILEPAIHAYIGLPIFESWNAPYNSFAEAPESVFQQDAFSLDKTNLSLNITLRAYIPKNTILKMDLERVKQSEEINSKIFIGMDMKF